VVREPGPSKAGHGQYLVPPNQAPGHPRTQRLGANSDLWFCEDGNAAQGIPMTPATVIVTDIYDSGDYTFHVRPLIRQHKLAKVNHRWIAKGLAVTFRTVEDAAKFRLLYDGDTT
jgi:hypothetical protein